MKIGLMIQKMRLSLHRLKRLQKQYDSVAQLVEQLTLNQWVEGSIPSGVTN